jgi:hypothetical protein
MSKCKGPEESSAFDILDRTIELDFISVQVCGGPLKLADLRDVIDQLDKEEITLSRAVEILNQIIKTRI